jgi:tripartite-type tricarboxylate transporter receptor subunit TctC
VLLLPVLAFPILASAQAYPSKPVRIVTEFVAGSIGDAGLRVVTNRMAETLGQPVVVDNRAGGGGTLAAETVARSAPDGYSMLYASSNTQVVRPHLVKGNTLDPLRDFTPVTAVSEPTIVIVANPSVPASDLKSLIDYARANPGRLSYATSGIGSTYHLAGEQIRQLAGVDMVHVPYKALAQSLLDTVSGQVPLTYAITGQAMPHVKAGKLKIVAAVSEARLPGLPDVATVAESVKGFEPPPVWAGLFGPAGLPAPVLRRFYADTAKVLQQDDVKAKIAETGQRVIGNSPEDFSVMVRRHFDLVGRIVKSAGIQPE